MPLYEYRCKTCDHQFEIQQSFSDDALTVCPDCEGALRKVFSPVGITFKGSGFYKNDSRGPDSGSSDSKSSESTSSGETSSGSSESSSSTGSGDSGSSSSSSKEPATTSASSSTD